MSSAHHSQRQFHDKNPFNVASTNNSVMASSSSPSSSAPSSLSSVAIQCLDEITIDALHEHLAIARAHEQYVPTSITIPTCCLRSKYNQKQSPQAHTQGRPDSGQYTDVPFHSSGERIESVITSTPTIAATSPTPQQPPPAILLPYLKKSYNSAQIATPSELNPIKSHEVNNMIIIIIKSSHI